MSITPKNWDSFQHYKDRAPSWIKLHKGLLTDFRFSRLPVASRALAPMLWLLASEYERGEITATMEEIAFRMHMTERDLVEAISPLIDSGFFIASEALAKPEQVACLEKRREENKIEKDTCAVGKPTRTDEKFEEFWKSLPKRDGANPKEPARKLFHAAVKAGEDPDAIIAGARQCARSEAKNANTPYIPQTVKWLRDRRWRDYGQQIAEQGAPFDWEAVVKLKATIGVWSKHAGPEPGAVGCRAPAEILQKYGLAS